MSGDELDEVSSKVVGLLGTASAAVLEEACGEVGLQIPPSADGNARKLFRLINRYINSQAVLDSADEGLAVLKAIEAVLVKAAPPPKTATTTAESTADDKKSSKAKVKTESTDADREEKKEKVREKESGSKSVVSLSEGVDFLKLRDLKINGNIGGDKAMSYSSLVYQIENAQQMGFKDPAICAAVLKNCQQSNLRSYLELKKDLTVDSLLDIIRLNYSAKDFTTLFNEMCNKVQGEGEKLGAYLLSMMVLREQVMDMAEEEGSGISVERNFVQACMQRALYMGIRENYVRLQLKDLLDKKGVSDDEIFKTVNKTIVQEKEREEKLLASSTNGSKSADVNAVNVEASMHTSAAAKQSQENKKKRENTMQLQIQALQADNEENKKVIAEIRSEQQTGFAEMKSLIVASMSAPAPAHPGPPPQAPGGWYRNAQMDQNWRDSAQCPPPAGGAPAMLQQHHGGGLPQGAQPGSNKKTFKCQACKQNNAYCSHCFKCGDGGHRAANCPN
jgi:hypothetical protein